MNISHPACRPPTLTRIATAKHLFIAPIRT